MSILSSIVSLLLYQLLSFSKHTKVSINRKKANIKKVFDGFPPNNLERFSLPPPTTLYNFRFPHLSIDPFRMFSGYLHGSYIRNKQNEQRQRSLDNGWRGLALFHFTDKETDAQKGLKEWQEDKKEERQGCPESHRKEQSRPSVKVEGPRARQKMQSCLSIKQGQCY